MDVTGILARPITLSTPAPGPAEPDRIGSTHIRYTSVVPDGKTRAISAAIASGSIPSGCRLKLSVDGLRGNGSFGSAVPYDIYLTDNPQEIITGIGNCYTGTSGADGVLLKCSLEIEDASKLNAHEASTVTVLFTMN